VLASERVNGRYQRLDVDGGGLLEACGIHPTMWIRLWFDRDGRAHQRADKDRVGSLAYWRVGSHP
jgi:hypothetical protein